MSSCLRLAAPWLDQTRELTVDQLKNAAWHHILTPSEEKFVTWLRRVGGRFQAKVEETLAKGKIPNLRNYASQYRDTEPELVWRMACVWESGRTEMFRSHSTARFQELEQMFLRGALDRDLIDEVRVLDPSFQFLELRFMRDLGVDVNAHHNPAEDLSNAEVEKQKADFKLFKLRLQSEQHQWRRYVTALKELGDSTMAEVTKHREALHDALTQAVKEHTAASFCAECTATREAMPSFFESSIKNFADQPPARRVDDVLRINVHNLAMQGSNHSRLLKETVDTIRTEANHHPSTSIAIVVLPNTPAWGQGQRTGPAFQKQVSTARSTVLAALSEECNGLVLQECVAMYDPESMYSPDREYRVDFLLVVSEQRDQAGNLLAQFTKSLLWRRRAVPKHLPVFHRANFADWTKAMTAFDRGNLDASAERRQWASGSGLLGGILEALLTDVPTSNVLPCHVRDHTMYDDQLGLAVLQLDAKHQAMQGVALRLGYAGATWKAAMPGASFIARNAAVALEDHIYQFVKENNYRLPNFRSLGAEPKVDDALKPSINLEVFTLCAPRANQELPLRQSVLDDWNKIQACHPPLFSLVLERSGVL